MSVDPISRVDAWRATVAAAEAKGLLHEGFLAFASFALVGKIGPRAVSDEHLRNFRIFLLEDDVDPDEAGSTIAEIRRTILLLQVDPETRNLITSQRIRPPRGARQAQRASLSAVWQRDLAFIRKEVVGGTEEANQDVVERFVLGLLEAAAGFEAPINDADQLFQLKTYVALHAVRFGKLDERNHHAAAYKFLTLGKEYHTAKKDREDLVDAFIAARKRLKTRKRSIAPSASSRIGQINDALWTKLQAEGVRRLWEACEAPRKKRLDDGARMGLFVSLVAITARSRAEVAAAEFALPLAYATADDDAAAILVGGMRVPLAPVQINAIANWRRTRHKAWEVDHLRVFARCRDGVVPTPACFSTGTSRVGELFGIDITPRTLQLEAVRSLKRMKVPEGQIQSHLGIQQKINFESRFGSLLKMDSAERFGDAVLDAVDGKFDCDEADNA